MHTAIEALLIKRADSNNLWQSVTGSLEWGESVDAAAVRELREETGLRSASLRATGIRRRYTIVDKWKARYHPNVVCNYETLFYCSLEARADICLNRSEHTDFIWTPLSEASKKVFFWTNRLAIKNLI